MKKIWLIPIIIAAAIVLLIPIVGASSLDIYCQKFGSRDTCLKNIAMQRNDPTYCVDIDSVSVRNDCYSKLADQLNDKSLCEKIRKAEGTYEDKWECIEEFYEGTEEELPACNEFEGDDDTQDECYEFFFKRLEDVELCKIMNKPKNVIDCFEDASIENDDINHCDDIKSYVDPDYCKKEEVDMCDTPTKLNDIVADCRDNVVYTRLRIRCKTFKPKMDSEMKDGDKNEFVFKGDDAKKESFTVEVKDINFQTEYTSINLKVGRSRRDYNLKVGSTANLDYVYVLLMKMWQEDDEDESDVGDAKVELCLHRKPKPEEPDEDEEDEIEEEDDSDTEAKVEVEVEEENDTEDKDEKIVIELLPENATELNESEDSDKDEKVGVLRSMIKWFWGLFGLGK